MSLATGRLSVGAEAGFATGWSDGDNPSQVANNVAPEAAVVDFHVIGKGALILAFRDRGPRRGRDGRAMIRRAPCSCLESCISSARVSTHRRRHPRPLRVNQ